jgi:O-antigen ligase
VIAVPAEARATGAGLIAAAFLAPFSATRLVGPLTLGRAAVLCFAALLAIDLLGRGHRLQLGRPSLLLIASYVGLSAWVFLSSVAWGCNCDGKASGFYEFATFGVLALAALALEPRLRDAAILATLGGVVLAALLALAGVGSLNSATVDLSETGGRLSGTFGNPNELGFAAALAVPIVLAHRSLTGKAIRIALIAALLILVAVLIATYSRGAILAAAVGSVALLLWQSRGSRRRVAIVLAAAACGALMASVLYAVFERERRDASFGSVPRALAVLDVRDLSGWDGRARGPIPRGPAHLLVGQPTIAVRATEPGEGVSFRWGEGQAGETYRLTFRARAWPAVAFSYALADRVQWRDGRLAGGEIGRRWREFSLSWHPRRRAPHAALFVWPRSGPSTFALDDVEVVATDAGRVRRAIAVPDRLEGSLYDRLRTSGERAESRYVESRLDAARLATRAFGSEPLLGIGWSTFPTYAAARLDYGLLAAHNEYLAIAAELGLVGVALLALLIAAVALGVRRIGSGSAEAAALGMLAAAAVGLAFVEALPVPQLSVPVAIAAAVVCSRPRGGGGD